MLIEVRKQSGTGTTVSAYVNPDHVVSIEPVLNRNDAAMILLSNGQQILVNPPADGIEGLAKLFGNGY